MLALVCLIKPIADEDGFVDGDIVDDDRINVIYRHVSETDTVIGVGTLTRKKSTVN
jgi:hypothetical protein